MVAYYSYFVWIMQLLLQILVYLYIYLEDYLLRLPLGQGTVVEGTIQQLFEGHHMNYIECVNVDYKSTRKESFYGMHFCLQDSIVYYVIPCILGTYGILDI